MEKTFSYKIDENIVRIYEGANVLVWLRNNKISVGFDVDGVSAQTHETVVGLYNRLNGTNHST